MAVERHLSRAPITEALFDFRVTLPTDFQVEKFRALQPGITDAYPLMQEIRRFEARFETQPNKTVASEGDSGGIQGFFFKSPDGLNVAQFRRDGFTFNRLAPYTDWDGLCPEALRLWSMFVSVALPEKVDRLAVRYINRIKLPPNGNLNEFLEVLPPPFPGSPELLSSFVMRQARHDPKTGYMVNIAEALEPGLSGSDSILILDIDVSKVGGLRLDPSSLQPLLSEMRTIKNEVFFKAITDKTATEYE